LRFDTGLFGDTPVYSGIVLSDDSAGDAPVSGAAASSVRARGRSSGRHGRPSSLRGALGARLEETPFSRGVVLMVTAGLVLVVVVVGTTVALTTGGPGTKTPRSAEPPPETPMSTDSPARPTPDGRSPGPRSSHRRPKTSASTVVGSTIPRPTASHPADPSPSRTAPPVWWPPHHKHPRWRYTISPPPWWPHD
jgi:uncharacterized iron-regulated membrane protein